MAVTVDAISHTPAAEPERRRGVFGRWRSLRGLLLLMLGPRWFRIWDIAIW